MSFVVLCLAVVALTYAAPPIAPLNMKNECVDGVNNVIRIADVNDGALTIHANDVVAQTYDDKDKPSCYYGRAAVSLPGQIKLVRGQVVVGATNADIGSAELRVTLKKNSWIVGTVCNDGHSCKKQVPENVCHHTISPDLPEPFVDMLRTPGTYDLEMIEKEAHQAGIIKLPHVTFGQNIIAKGDWQAQFAVILNGQKIAHIKAPSNTDWLHIN